MSFFKRTKEFFKNVEPSSSTHSSHKILMTLFAVAVVAGGFNTYASREAPIHPSEPTKSDYVQIVRTPSETFDHLTIDYNPITKNVQYGEEGQDPVLTASVDRYTRDPANNADDIEFLKFKTKAGRPDLVFEVHPDESTFTVADGHLAPKEFF